MSDIDFTPREMTRFRTIERECAYRTDYDPKSIIFACEMKGISPERLCRTLHRFALIGIPQDRIWGCLRIVFELDKPPNYFLGASLE